MSWGRVLAEPQNPRRRATSSRIRADTPVSPTKGDTQALKRSTGRSDYHAPYPQVYRHSSVAGGWVQRVVTVTATPATATDMVHKVSEMRVEGCQEVFMGRHSPSRSSAHTSTLSRLLASSPRPTSTTSPTNNSKPRRSGSAKMSKNPRISAPISPPVSLPPPSPPRTCPPHYGVLSTSFSALEDDIALHENSLYEIRGSLAAVAAAPLAAATLQQPTPDLLSSLENAAKGLAALRHRFETLSIALLRLRVSEMRRRRQHDEDEDAGEGSALESLKSHADLLQRNLKWAEDFREEIRLEIDGVYFAARDLEVVEVGKAGEPEVTKEVAGKKRKGMTSIAEALEVEEDSPSAEETERKNSLGNMF